MFPGHVYIGLRACVVSGTYAHALRARTFSFHSFVLGRERLQCLGHQTGLGGPVSWRECGIMSGTRKKQSRMAVTDALEGGAPAATAVGQS